MYKRKRWAENIASFDGIGMIENPEGKRRYEDLDIEG
jgi:hypothetical protein